MLSKKWILPGFWLITSLACLTNTRVSNIPPPPPTKTPIATFTATALPPTPTLTLLVSDTPTPTEVRATTPPVESPTPTATSVPTATAPPPAATPLPTSAPPTAPPPPPPTATPLPPPTPLPAPAPDSPVATPTSPSEPGTPPGQYEALDIDTDNDCANIGVIGQVRDRGNDKPVQWVTIQVLGETDDDDDQFDGPFIGKTGADGRYNIYIGPINEVGSQKYEVKVIGGPNVESEDTVDWETSKDCRDAQRTQILDIYWGYEPR